MVRPFDRSRVSNVGTTEFDSSLFRASAAVVSAAPMCFPILTSDHFVLTRSTISVARRTSAGGSCWLARDHVIATAATVEAIRGPPAVPSRFPAFLA
jgi:hypothetical protein